MPPPVLLAPAGHLALHVSRSVLVGLSDAALAILLGRLAWRSLPEWIRHDVAVQQWNRDTKEKGELASLTSVVETIQAVIEMAAQRVVTLRKRRKDNLLITSSYDDEHDPTDDDEEEPFPYWNATILAYTQLILQYRALHPEQLLSSTSTIGRSEQILSPDDPVLAELQSYLSMAVAAYETDTDNLCLLLQSDENDDWEVLDHNSLLQGVVRPTHVGHFVAVSEHRRQVVVAVRGTASLEDMLTDCCGGAVQWEHTEQQHGVEVQAAQPLTLQIHHDGTIECLRDRHERITTCEENRPRCHHGIYVAAQRLVQHLQQTIGPSYLTQRNYQLVLCGHSLGAGVATLAGILLRNTYPDTTRVVAFAPPPVLDHDSAVACHSFVTSLVNQSDVVPRLSLVNMTVWLECLRVIGDRLKQQNLLPTGPKSTLALLRKLMQPLRSSDTLLSLEEFRTICAEAEEQVELLDPDHLYVAGRVLVLVEQQQEATIGDSRDDDDEQDQPPSVQCVDTDGTTGILRRLEVDIFRLVTDHITTTYYENLDRLIRMGTSASPPS